jgi:hypothetical protein
MFTKVLTKTTFLNKKGVGVFANPFIFLVPKPGFEPGQAYAH